jgi:hypothetical protein
MDRIRRTTTATRWFARTGKRLLRGPGERPQRRRTYNGTYRVPSASKTWTSLNTLVPGVVIDWSQLVGGANVAS